MQKKYRDTIIHPIAANTAPGRLLRGLSFTVWREFINQKAEDHQYNGGDDGTHRDQSIRQILKNRYMCRNEYIQRITNTDSTSRNMITSMNITV